MTITNIDSYLPLYTDNDYLQSTALTSAGSATSSADFSALLNEAISNSLMTNTIALLGGGDSSSSSDSMLSGIGGGGDLSALMLQSALTDGQLSDEDISMFLLMMMMQEFSGSDISPLYTAMGALLGNSGSSLTNNSDIPTNAGVPVSVRSGSVPGSRSAQALNEAISALHVETAERYRPYRNGSTYCNIFVWDLTSAMNAELPHYVDSATGAPRSYPDTAGAYELDANGVHDWLDKYGAGYGWTEVSAEQAQAAANQGLVAVTAWRNNTGGAGHVQVVCPSRDNSYNQQRGVTVAQAGSTNYSYAYLDQTFRSSAIPEVRYFVHQ